MNISNLSKRIEIAFWITVIPLMKESSQIQRLLRSLLISIERINQRADKLVYGLQVMAWAGTGLVLGFVIGLLATSFK